MQIIFSYLEYASILAALLYCITAFIILRGLMTEYRVSDVKYNISILIPARNEEKYLAACLDSLTKITYPVSMTEVIILDDRSEDNTAAIARSFCEKHEHIRLYRVAEDSDGLTGKMNVLKQGIDQSSGDIICVTDADCEVSPGWADGLVSYFTERTGMVGGVTVLSRPGTSESVFSRVQALDWLFLQGVASGAAGSGFPTSILGNNFAFRKQAYQETGGFEKIGFSVTEDMVLMQAIRKLRSWQIKYPLSPRTQIYSQPEKSLSQLFSQRMRWISGGLIGPLSGWIMMLTAFLAHLLPLLVFILTKPGTLILIAILLPIVSDLSFILRPLSRKINRADLLKYFTVFEIYYYIYTTLFAALSLLPIKIRWKNRKMS